MRFFISLASVFLFLLTFFDAASSAIISKDLKQIEHSHVDDFNHLQTFSIINNDSIGYNDSLSSDLPLFLTADQINNNKDGSFSLVGNAQFRRMDSVINGNYIKFYSDKGNIYVDGNVYIRLGSSTLVGSDAFINIDAINGYINNVKFRSHYNEAYAEADKVDLINKSKIKLYNVIYSGLENYNESWYTKSSSVTLDFDKNIAHFINARLYLCNIPIFYMPYMSFPIKDEPKSGFLMPNYSLVSGNGYEFVIPYYMNISRYCDATIHNRVSSKRGFIISSEFRYVNDNYYGMVDGSYIHKDRVTGCNRWYYKFRNCFYIRDNLILDLDISRASDNYFFIDIKDNNDQKYLSQISKLSWFGNHFDSYIKLSSYQILVDGIESNFYYKRLPEISIRYHDYFCEKLGLDFDINMVKLVRSSYVRDLLNDSGNRLQFYPSVHYNIINGSYYITPKFGVHLSEYNINSCYKSRVVPICSLSGGAFCINNVNIFKKSFKQIIEPKFSYLYIPYYNQEDVPCYDTNLVDFSFQSLFDENVYDGGWDRISDANHITFLLKASYDDTYSEFERMSISAANRIFLDNKKVFIPGETLSNNINSNLLMSFKTSPSNNTVIEACFDYDLYKNNLCNYLTSIRWNPKKSANVNILYKSQNDMQYSLKTVVLSFQWPLSEKFYGIGRLDILHSCNKEGDKQISAPKFLIGFEYKKDESWTNRLVFHRYSLFNGNINNTLFFQLELRGIGAIGTDMKNLLENNIFDYQTVQ
ncbi:LPS-assembly protein [Candidatus Kinetoplastibacterium oncopeltii TCC290E]|uniref:LPS-assembly protein LptD n=1 Tax=Candidatus Kinetoplastidibacterium stringomonadis TCC290E TaxID=1208920 RepID=M1LVL8_9PROT|nr:LPS assembly protein LptD [Candidatus Kinetoplastibacterium oncopeltii]AGF48131.1 LPS-assembly protein [Candidatus Kinetoplastibacterium oncopeltii TCC290E]